MSMIGKTLGNFEITSQLGKGGMGEVYQAKDRKLGRDVAIKVLPEEFARDADRVARFQREAKLLASLNHPNIAAIYGLEESGGTNFLVLELVEGDTLADQIKRAPIPVEESLKLALQIAEALEAAHEKGVIHRDLKPANIKVTPDGKVKVLDFGLAKAFAGEQAEMNLSNSPTLSNAATQQGVILGTAAYMSPEQARGKAVDKRTDVWAFGCVLFEMITGRPAFSGSEVTDILAAVIRAEPDWNCLPTNLHWRLREIVERCLKKDSKDRTHDISDVRLDIQKILADPRDVLVQQVASAELRTGSRTKLLCVAAVVLTAIAVGLSVWYLKPQPSQPSAHLSITLPPGEVVTGHLPLTFSPDGKHIAYVSYRSDGVSQLYLRALNNAQSKPIPGSEGANQPVFSPDGQWIAFFAQGKLKKISIAGGMASEICTSGFSAGASWGPDDTVVFSPSSNSGLLRVSAAGGTPEVLTTLDSSKGEVSHRYPQILPGGKAVIFTITTGIGWDDQHVALLLLKTGERRILIRGGHTGRFVPTGHLVYSRAGVLMAVPFDLARLEVTSSAPITIVEGIRQSSVIAAEYSFSASGSLAFIPESPHAFERRLAWLDYNGKVEPLATPPRNYETAALSPDRRQIAVTIVANTADLWIYDFGHSNLTRLTFEGSSQYPVWTPDGKRLAYRATRAGYRNIFWRAADGTGAEERLTEGKNLQTPRSWSPNGKVLAFDEISPTSSGRDIWIVSMEGSTSDAAGSAISHKLSPFLQTPFSEMSPTFSPDGHWLAYTSNQSGKEEIYVRPFPGPGREWQVSTEGAKSARWAPKGRELFYGIGKKVMALDIQTEPMFNIGKPRILFEGQYTLILDEGEFSDVDSVGRRFLVPLPVEPKQPANQIQIILNWFEELKQRAPVE
jgi:serine/threonine protein kinase